MHKTALTLLTALLYVSALAQQISVTDAQTKAYEYLHQGAKVKARAAQADDALTLIYTSLRSSDNKTLYYVFNNGDDDGFVIIGGDECARDILAYCDHGSFDPENLPDNFRWWLSQYEKQISHAIDLDLVDRNLYHQQAARRAAAAATSTKQDVSPLVAVKWDQDYPYNKAIPRMDDCYRFYAGCVATATAQVMKYYEWPKTGQGSKSYTDYFTVSGKSANYSKTATDYSMTFSSTFSDHTYDWANMLDYYPLDASKYTEAQGAAIAQLIYDCGVAVEMQYGTSGSGAYNEDVQTALANYFGYDASVTYKERSFYTDEAWEELIYNELINKRPVILTGFTSSDSGHAFVCDGYQSSDNTFHFNWGWSGGYNCYCPMSGTGSVTPDEDDEPYNLDMEATIHIMKDQGGLELPNIWEYKSKYHDNFYLTKSKGATEYVSKYDYTTGSDSILYLYTTERNKSRTLKNFDLGVKAVDINSGLTCYLACDVTLQLSRKQISLVAMPISLRKLEFNGLYEISPVVRNVNSTSNKDWVDVNLLPTETLPIVNVTCKESQSPRDISFCVPTLSIQQYRTTQISHDNVYSGKITFTSSDETIATVDANGIITGVNPGKVTITAHGEEMKLKDGVLYNATTTTFEIIVTEVVKDTPEASISRTSLIIGNTATIEVSSQYDGTPTYSSTNTEVATVENGVVTAVAVGSAQIHVYFPETHTWKSVETVFDITVDEAKVVFDEAPYFYYYNNPYKDNLKLYINITNQTSVTQSDIYLSMKLYSLSDNEEETEIYTKQQKLSLEGNSSYSSKATFGYAGLYTADKKYRIRFYMDQDYTKPWNVPYIDFTYRDALLIDYTLTSAGVGTIILPFDAKTPSGWDWKAYTVEGIDANGYLILAEESSLKRYVPYIIIGNSASATFSGPKAIDQDFYTVGNMVGALTGNVPYQAGDYILQNHDGEVLFYAYDPETKKPNGGYSTPFRAFLRLGDAAGDVKAFHILDEETTSIETLVPDAMAGRPAGIYGLDGTRRSALQPGENIVVNADGTTLKVYLRK